MLMLVDALAIELETALAAAGFAARILAWWTLASIVVATVWSVVLWGQPRDD